MADLQRTLDRLLNHDTTRRSGDSGREWIRCCPAHEDRSPSLSVGLKHDRIVLHCFAGCETADVLRSAGLEWRDLYADDGAGSKRDRQRKGGSFDFPPPATQENGRPAVRIDWNAKQQELTSFAQIADARKWLAGHLVVSTDSIIRLEIGYQTPYRSADGTAHPGKWTYPERNGTGAITYIGTRDRDGSKASLPGGHRGLIVPVDIDAEIESADPSIPIISGEGMSGRAALLTMGLLAVNRPSATKGAEELAEVARRTKRQVIVLGDRDAGIGQRGAEQAARTVAAATGESYSWALPPGAAKDASAWLTNRLAECGASAENQEVCLALGREFLALLKKSAVEVRPANCQAPPGGAVRAVIAATLASMPEATRQSPPPPSTPAADATDATSNRVAIPPATDAEESRVRELLGMEAPHTRDCPRGRGMVLSEVATSSQFAIRSRCRCWTCPACRPLLIDERATHHGLLLMRCQTVTRIELPGASRERWESIRVAMHRAGRTPWVRLEMTDGRIVVYAGGCIDLDGAEHLTGEDAVRRMGEDLRSGRLAGQYRDPERKRQTPITASAAWQLCAAEKTGKFRRECSLHTADPERVRETVQRFGGKITSRNLSGRAIMWSIAWTTEGMLPGDVAAMLHALERLEDDIPPPRSWEEVGDDIDSIERWEFW